MLSGNWALERREKEAGAGVGKGAEADGGGRSGTAGGGVGRPIRRIFKWESRGFDRCS